ncbi:hypothetical protein TVAG_399400 [Trichomonas vaginalis G3]|uniref:HECT domain-containing protein n=1 Tax=Trichomonas vaginalis (strain ATCC PRA-98 / G3) TaxID=412133 RepID=A2E5X8_TRIV3|nr:ubiquitin protein ligase protein [Trichomonas vaginalis G3]EAY11935.1 hypothetical protein TVAG_399400 [Trichomonas vaginalis G3]KAI5530400.1 ubiquitin protein ligase protein [Trichomonas vaginalis G3]|eukprot:XP_001324158.1 hypothetical protein [Trichomonas vaginalis G3]
MADAPEPVNFIQDKSLEMLLDSYAIQLSLSDYSTLPRYPRYLYAKYFADEIKDLITLDCSKTFKDVKPNTILTFHSTECDGRVYIKDGNVAILPFVPQLSYKVQSSQFRIEILGPTGKKFKFFMVTKLPVGKSLPINFRQIILSAEQNYNFNNDIRICQSLQRNIECSDFYGTDKRLLHMRTEFIRKFSVLKEKFDFHLECSIFEGYQAFIDKCRDKLQTMVYDLCHDLRHDFNLYFSRNEANKKHFRMGGKGYIEQLYSIMKSKGIKPEMLGVFLRYFRVNFVGEGGVDAGGPRREAYDNLMAEIIDSDEYFVRSPKSKEMGSVVKIPSLTARPEYISLVGSLVASTFLNGVRFPFRFEKYIWKSLFGYPITASDAMSIDSELMSTVNSLRCGYKGVVRMKSLSGESLKAWEITEETEEEKVQSILDEIISQRIKEMNNGFAPFKDGFLTVIPFKYLKILSPDVIEELLCGDNEITAYQLTSILRFRGNYPLHYTMFTRCIEEMTNKERISLVKFITGNTTKPDSITVHFYDDGREHDMKNGLLPYAHTCFKSIDMYLYTSYEVMLSKLRTAIEHGSLISDGKFDFSAYVGGSGN